MKRIFTTTVRLNLDDEDDRRAFEHDYDGIQHAYTRKHGLEGHSQETD